MKSVSFTCVPMMYSQVEKNQEVLSCFCKNKVNKQEPSVCMLNQVKG